MMLISRLLLALALSITGLTASAQDPTVSGNLVPFPSQGASNGLTINQTYAVNQALSAVGAGVMIHGFDYGYNYQLGNSWSQCTAFNQDGSCSWTMTFNPRVDVNFNIRSNTNTVLYNITHIETGVNSGNRSREYQYRFNDPRDILTLGNIVYSASTSQNASISNMYHRAVYTVDPCVTNSQSSPQCPGYKTYYNISDDGHAIVPIPFGFPFYGKLFTHSIFFDNGTVSFYTPNQEPQRWGAGTTGGNFSGNMGSQFYYSIMPLWTDLINYNGAHYTQQSNQHLKYTWENVSEFGNLNSSNTFSLEIRPTGFVGIQYDQIDVSWATTGMVGNAALGEFATYNSQTSWSVNETIATDCSDPLVNVNCPGYAQAYFDQQCSINPLYNSQCPGYAAAYFTQQCSINTLYDPACPGYATAYYDYQCSVNALYHTGCPNYAIAYFDQQCGLDGLYSNQCPNYGEAYAKKYILTAEPVTVAMANTIEPVATSVAEPTKETTAVAVTDAPAASAGPADKTSPVQLTAAPAAVPAETKKEAAPAASNARPAASATRQALAERRAAAQAAATAAAAAAKVNSGEMSSEMDSAASMEQQVELQNVVLGAMGFVAGFDAYGRATIPDAAGYQPFEIYRGQRNIDSPAGRRLLTGSDRLHQEIIDAQYK